MSDDQRLTWHRNWLALDDQHNRHCQTAFKTDPRSASNIDPSSLCSRTGGEARSGQLAQRVAA